MWGLRYCAFLPCSARFCSQHLEVSNNEITSNRVYYLAVTSYNKDPMWIDDDGNEQPLFNDQFIGRSSALCAYDPNNPGSCSFHHFRAGGLGTSGGHYRLELTGLCQVTDCSDFNHDGDVGTDLDIINFFQCLSGNCCSTCGTADFDCNGDVGTDADINAFFAALSGICPSGC
jgi:hypothetical protein